MSEPDEQTAIATTLSDTDALIQNFEKVIAKCRTIKQGMMQELLTGKTRLICIIRRKVEDATGQVTGQVEQEVQRLLLILQGDMSRQELQDILVLKGRDNFEKRYLKPALDSGYIAYTIPQKPQSRMQKYRLTEKGATVLKTVFKEKKNS